MQSFILSYIIQNDNNNNPSKSNTKNKEQAELHLNIWKVQVGKCLLKSKLYFDFGIRINSHIHKICLFIPFEICENDKDFDLGRLLTDNNQLLCTVFNRTLLTNASPEKEFIEVKDELNKSFNLYTLGEKNFEIERIVIHRDNEHQKYGTILKITLPEKLDSDKDKDIYIRFRLEPKNVGDVVLSEHVSNDFLQDAFSEIDLFDIRFNELRSVSIQASSKIRDDGFKVFSFDTIHLFYISDIKNNVSNGSSLIVDSRLLEKNLWNSYIPSNSKRTSYIAHHWRKKCGENDSPIEDYHIFFTSVYPKLNWLRLSIYLSVVILLSWAGSMLTFSVSSIFSMLRLSYIKPIIVGLMTVFIIVYFFVLSYKIIFKIRAR